MDSTFTLATSFLNELGLGGHNLNTDTLKVALSNTAPNTSQTTWNTTDHPAPAAANGYTAGGVDIENSWASAKLSAVDKTFVATAGGIGPFRYAIIYNADKSDKLVGWYDYASSITVGEGESFLVDFHATNGLLDLSIP